MSIFAKDEAGNSFRGILYEIGKLLETFKELIKEGLCWFPRLMRWKTSKGEVAPVFGDTRDGYSYTSLGYMNVETKEMLEQSSGQYRHPTFFPDDPQDIYTDFHYSSLFSTSNELDEKSICTLVQDHFLYIVQVKQDEKKGFEIYFSDNAKKKTSPIVCVWTDNGLFRKARELFSLASETRNQINLSYMTRKTIDSYMGELQEPESGDDLPF